MRSSIVALALLLLPGLAEAQLSKAQIEKAKKHFKAGMAAEAKGSYDLAVDEFTAAYEITKDPVVFYQIAKANEKAGHLRDALLYYERYLKEAKVSPQGEAEVEAKMAELQKKLAPPEEPKPPPEDTKPPEEALLPPEDTTTPPPAETPETPGDEAPRGWYRTGAWVAVGITAALLTTGGVLATSAASREEEVDRLVEFRNPVTGQPHVYSGTAMEQYQEAYDEGDSLDTWALIAFVGAGVTAGVAVTLFVLDSRAAPADAEEPSAVRLQPIVSPQGATVSASWNF